MTNWDDQLNDTILDIPCPNPATECSGVIKEKIGRLKMDPKLRCQACSFEFTVDAIEFRQAVSNIDKSIADLKRNLRLK
jgi:hypothetical protein